MQELFSLNYSLKIIELIRNINISQNIRRNIRDTATSPFLKFPNCHVQGTIIQIRSRICNPVLRAVDNR